MNDEIFDVARDTIGIPVDGERPLYPTHAGMWLRCGLQYYWRYVEGLKMPPTFALALGRAVGTAIAHYATNRLLGTVLTADDIATVAVDSVNAVIAESDGELSADSPEAGQTKDEAVVGTTTYHKTLSSLAVTGVEVGKIATIDNPIVDCEPVLVGAIVDLTATTSRFIGIEIKTRRRSQPIERDWLQLTTEAVVLGTPVERHQIVIKSPKNSTPTASVEAASWGVTGAIPALVRIYDTVRTAIKRGDFPNTSDPSTCAWCGFNAICPYALVKPN